MPDKRFLRSASSREAEMFSAGLLRVTGSPMIDLGLAYWLGENGVDLGKFDVWISSREELNTMLCLLTDRKTGRVCSFGFARRVPSDNFCLRRGLNTALRRAAEKLRPDSLASEEP